MDSMSITQHHSSLGNSLFTTAGTDVSFNKMKTCRSLAARRPERRPNHIKVIGNWKYYYRAVDKYGEIIDFLLTANRDTNAALRYLRKAIDCNGNPCLINIDESGANNAAIRQYNSEESTQIKIRRCKYLNNIVEQDHRLIKCIPKLMLGFKEFRCTQATLAGIELVRMLKKGQMRCQAGKPKTPAELFYGLAGYGGCQHNISAATVSVCDTTIRSWLLAQHE